MVSDHENRCPKVADVTVADRHGLEEARLGVPDLLSIALIGR
jgi:hypothetical protein